jgi:hypothetical protein
MTRWLKAQFADQERARRAVLTFATMLGTVGLCVLAGALLLARR